MCFNTSELFLQTDGSDLSVCAGSSQSEVLSVFPVKQICKDFVAMEMFTSLVIAYEPQFALHCGVAFHLK